MCLYCENKKDNSHFSCVSCDVGMCEDCYNSDCEHTEHLFDYHESIEDNEYYEFIRNKVISPYGYLCYNCLDKFREEFENQKNSSKNNSRIHLDNSDLNYDEMEKQNLTQEEMEKEFQTLLKNNPYSLETYWDYNDEISEENLMKYFNNELDLGEIIDDWEYVGNRIGEIIEEEFGSDLFEKNNELFDYLRDRCYDNWNYNYEDLLKNSYVRLRIQLNTNEEYLDLENHKESETYKYLKKAFKGTFKVKEFENEIFEVCGSNYVNLNFMCEVNGLTLIEMKKQIEEKGTLKLTKGLKAGLFNDWLGCGSCFDLELPKNIILNVKDWTKDNQSYYEVSIVGDNISRYGINETYGFTNDMWQELSY